jgi:acyl-CoA thioester hydrolase
MAFRHSFRVRWIDTDAAGIVHFSNYPRYFEACEEEFYKSLGLDFMRVHEKYHVALPRVEAHCNYKASCRFGDEIEISMSIREIAETTITYDFQVFLKASNKLAAEGYIKCIAVNDQWKAVQLPNELADMIRQSSV